MSTGRINIPRDQLEVRYSRSSGPGGQGVNRTESKVEIRFHLDSAVWIPFHVREKIKILARHQINQEGELILSSQESRSQGQNYETCVDKLAELIRLASMRDKKRVPTKATRSSKRRRVDSKKIRSGHKATRKKVEFSD
jgi:protein subunit release factor B